MFFRWKTKKPAALCFTLGSSKDEVLAAQGSPRGITNAGNVETWDFGSEGVTVLRGTRFFAILGQDTVTFQDGKVVGFCNDGGKLHVRMTPTAGTPAHEHFSLGSDANEVLRAQGTPSQVFYLTSTKTSWWQYFPQKEYDRHVISFDGQGKVSAVENTSGSLKFCLKAAA